MSRVKRTIFRLLGVVELIVVVYDWTKNLFRKKAEPIPLTRRATPPPLKPKPGGGSARRGPGG